MEPPWALLGVIPCPVVLQVIPVAGPQRPGPRQHNERLPGLATLVGCQERDWQVYSTDGVPRAGAIRDVVHTTQDPCPRELNLAEQAR